MRVCSGSIVFVGLIVANTICLAEASENERLWFTHPGEHWNSQALHLGNGYLGGSFYGGVKEERINVAEKSMWTGGPGENPDYNYGIRPGGRDHVKEIREAIVAGDVATSDQLARKYFTGDYRDSVPFRWSATFA